MRTEFVALFLLVWLIEPMIAAGQSRSNNFEPFTGADQNGDGFVSRIEFQQAVAVRFDRLDTDKSGRLNQDEFREGLSSTVRRRVARRAFSQQDVNGDGGISQEEYRAAADRFFQRADTNGDGQVSELERRQVSANLRGR